MFYKTQSAQEEVQGAFTKCAGAFLVVSKIGISLFLIFLCKCFDFSNTCFTAHGWFWLAVDDWKNDMFAAVYFCT